MTDAAIGEVSTESTAPVPPEGATELGVAPPQDAAPAGDVGDLETESFDPRIAIPETLGPVRRAVLEGLIDSEGPMSVAQLHALMPVGTPRGTAEAGILREYRSGRIIRTSPGHYTLAPVMPAEPPKPAASEPDHGDGHTDDQWLAALDAWAADPSSWDEELGPAPDHADNRIPSNVRLRFADRLRKREERRRDREAALARQAAADRELRDKLIAATRGNYMPGPALDDVSPIKAALALGVPLDIVLGAIRNKVDRLLCPVNEPAASWAEPRLLKAIGERYCKYVIIPSMVSAMEAASKAPQKPTGASEDMPAVPATAPLEPVAAPAAPQPQPGATPDGGPGSMAADLLREFGRTEADLAPVDAPGVASEPPPAADVPPTRESILSAFARRTPSQPATPPPPVLPQPRPVERPWFAGPQGPQPESGMTDDGWRFLIEGYRAGNVAWARKHGPPPKAAGCKVPARILKEFGLA